MTHTSVDRDRHLGLIDPSVAAGASLPMSGPRVISVAGAAGGVGTSTVAGLIGSLDVGVWHQHPVAVDVLVCRPSAASTARAERIVATHLADIGCRPVLVVVSDGHRRAPADSRARLTMLTPYCAAIVHVPWVSAWRDTTTPVLDPVPAALTRAVRGLRVALQLPSPRSVTPATRRRRPRKETP